MVKCCIRSTRGICAYNRTHTQIFHATHLITCILLWHAFECAEGRSEQLVLVTHSFHMNIRVGELERFIFVSSLLRRIVIYIEKQLKFKQNRCLTIFCRQKYSGTV